MTWSEAFTTSRRSSWIVALIALLIGVGTAASYYLQDLTLSHYDAKAHLVVARRIFDSIQPGWMRLVRCGCPAPSSPAECLAGTSRRTYRTGLSAVAFSVIGFVIGISQYIHEGIGSLWADSLIQAGRHAGWVLIDEEAEGGDVLARLSRSSREFLAGFKRECEGGGVAFTAAQQHPGGE